VREIRFIVSSVANKSASLPMLFLTPPFAFLVVIPQGSAVVVVFTEFFSEFLAQKSHVKPQKPLKSFKQKEIELAC